MTATTLIQGLRARGVKLVPDGHFLRCRPRAALTPDDPVELKTNKAAVIQALQAEIARTLVCYSCKRSRFWHSVYGVTVCARCHPPASPHLVERWIETEASS